MTTGDVVVDVRGLVAGYRRRPVLRGADLSARAGEIVGIVGENGCGKSTLLFALAGLLRPSAGSVELRGPIGFCPQQPSLYDGLTVDETLALFGAAYGMARTAIDARGTVLLERFSFLDARDRRVGELSAGTRQKLSLTIALLHGPAVLLLDEPYQGFDWETYLRFWALAAELRAAGACVVVVSHLIAERDRMDRVLALRGGVLVPS